MGPNPDRIRLNPAKSDHNFFVPNLVMKRYATLVNSINTLQILVASKNFVPSTLSHHSPTRRSQFGSTIRKANVPRSGTVCRTVHPLPPPQRCILRSPHCTSIFRHRSPYSAIFRAIPRYPALFRPSPRFPEKNNFPFPLHRHESSDDKSPRRAQIKENMVQRSHPKSEPFCENLGDLWSNSFGCGFVFSAFFCGCPRATRLSRHPISPAPAPFCTLHSKLCTHPFLPPPQ